MNSITMYFILSHYIAVLYVYVCFISHIYYEFYVSVGRNRQRFSFCFGIAFNFFGYALVTLRKVNLHVKLKSQETDIHCWLDTGNKLWCLVSKLNGLYTHRDLFIVKMSVRVGHLLPVWGNDHIRKIKHGG